MMVQATTVLFGIEVPSASPAFLGVVGAHVLAGIACVVSGAVAMLSPKRAGRHPCAGTIYYWCLTFVFLSAFGLALVRWEQDSHLFMLGALAFVSATVGRNAMRQRRAHWLRLHIGGMGLSYIFLLTAFFVDNGKQLPFWKDLPAIAYWIVPAVAGLPILVWALLRHRLVRQSPSQGRV